EPDLDHAEQPGNRGLFEADVLDALVGHGARRAAEEPVLDANVLVAKAVAEVAPGDPGEHRADHHHPGDRRDDEVAATVPAPATEQQRDGREQQVPETGDGAHHEAQRAGPPPALFRRCARVRGHIVSRLTCARISSRMASASSRARPGSATEALWLPAVCSTSVARP